MERIDKLEVKVDNNHKELNEMIEDLKEDIETVEVKNGGGRPIKFKRDDFHQHTYDRLSFKGWHKKAAALLGACLLILQIIIAIKLLFIK